MSYTCRHCGETTEEPKYREYCERCDKNKSGHLTGEDLAVIEANTKKWAAKAHLIPDHVWLKISKIFQEADRRVAAEKAARAGKPTPFPHGQLVKHRPKPFCEICWYKGLPEPYCEDWEH